MHRLIPLASIVLIALPVCANNRGSIAEPGQNVAEAVAPGNAAAHAPVIDIEDVARFYKVYDAAQGHPTLGQIQRKYLNKGSRGLKHFVEVRDITAAKIVETLNSAPQIYVNGTRCIKVLPGVRQRMAIVLANFAHLYPEASFPPVTIAVGRGKPVGVTDASGVMIGLEALCAVNYLGNDLEDRFVRVIAHEYAHVQQAIASPKLYNDANPTVLEGSLIEGAAEFMTELTSGKIAYAYFTSKTKGHEKDIESAFAADEDKTDLSNWLDNGTLTEPGDLGYWVGYRISKSYYEHAADKPQAVRDILQITDPKAFLAKSAWFPGMWLE